MGVCNNKISYYELLRKKMKQSYDLIQANESNRKYSFKINQFVSSKKRKIFDILIGETYDWKFYLLNRLDSNRFNVGNWENYLHNFIEEEIENKKENIYKKYILENEMFLEQFNLRNFPQLALKESKRLHEPLLFLLFDVEEIETYSEESQKLKKYEIDNNEKNKKTKNEILTKNGPYIIDKEKNDNKDIIEDDENDNVEEEPRNFTISKLNDLESKFLSKNILDEKNQNKYYSYQIRKHINLIRRQLEKPEHPINKIIKYFSEIYDTYIKKYIANIKQDKNKIEYFKNNIIIDIQNFIDIIAIALKLFYMKSINYDFFKYEKDEFINLICFILFNQKDFEKSLFRFFELSNEEKQKQLIDKIIKLGDITPKDVGISIKFSLNQDTKKLKGKKELNEKPKEDIGIVKYFKKMDIQNEEKRRNSHFVEVEETEIISSFDDKRKLSLFVPDISRERVNNSIINQNDVIYRIKEKNKKERIERTTITSYKEFSETFNNINEKFKKDLYSNQSEFKINSEDTEYDLNNPYRKAIEFIETLKYYKTPLDKLTIIALVSALITDCIDDFWKDEKNLKKNYLQIDSDELLSIYLYIILKMNVESIFTHLDYIQHFTGNISKQSIIGYFYTTVEGCIKFIMDAEKKEDLGKNVN